MPEWVHVWFWLRFVRGVMTPLPQQGINPAAMSMLEYQGFEDEWESAGAPRTTPSTLVIAMGGSVDVPF